MTTFGEVSWTDDSFDGDKKYPNSKDLFLRLKEGDNEMRLITQPYQYLVHKYKKENDPGYGTKVNCSAINGSCPLCEAGDKAKPRWFLGVISRDTGTFKILDISYAVFSQIRKYAKNTKTWGDPSKYDINIVVDKAGGATGYYSVQPCSKEPLSAEDQKIKDGVDLSDLQRRVTPPTPQQVQARLDKINGVGEGSAAPTAAGKKAVQVKTVAKAPTVSMTDDEEIGESFPPYNGGDANA
jgi:hypothetical protein